MSPATDNIEFTIRYLVFLGVVVMLTLEGVHQSRHPWLWTVVGVALAWLAYGWSYVVGGVTLHGGVELSFKGQIFALFRIFGLILMLVFLVTRSWFVIRCRQARPEEQS